MQKKIIVVGHHRSVELANRNLRRLVRVHKAEFGSIVARRNGRGRFSRRGRDFTFELVLKRKRKPKGKLFRLTIAITYPHGSAKKKKYVGYYLKHWKGDAKKLTDSKEEELVEITVSGLEKHLGYPRSRFWFDLKGNTSVEQPTKSGEDPKLKGIWELFSDEPSQVVGKFDKLANVKQFIEEFEEE